MRHIYRIAHIFTLVFAAGCATLPSGPSVNVLPSQGKSFETFRAEDATCRDWAEKRLGIPAQQAYDQTVAAGAVGGTAIGAGLGAVVGSASGHAGPGAAIGAATGLVIGTATGSSAGQVYGREAQRRYDNAYVQCMYSYGNQLPGYVRAAAPQPRAVASPPPSASASVPEDYPPPAEVYVEDAPQFIYSPDLNMYIAVGVPYDLVYNGRDYFYFNGGRWYRGPYYNGPWRYVPRRAYPPAFVRYRIDRIRYMRDIEFRRYEHDRGHYDGRFHRPERRRMEHRS